MSKIVGIDLGTTNSLVAVVEGGTPVVIPSAEGHHLFPSVVGFSRSGERLVGSTAKRQAVSNPERTIISVKRHMGTDFKVHIDDNEFSPQEISAMVLHKVKADAEAYLGYTVEKAVITVPAYFNDSERQATKDAGAIAGLDVVRIINEPTASCLAYGLDKMDQNETILVWDLGGGTFDVSLLEIGDGVFEVKATAGDSRLGGDDWDQRIIDWLVDEFRKQYSLDLRTDRVAMQRLKEESEKTKIKLSSETSVQIKLPFIAADSSGPKHLDFELSRSKFQELTADLVERTVGPANQAIEDACVGKTEIDKVLLVGGSTRMPAIQDKVRQLFGLEPSREIDPDKVVSMGAAIQGAVMTGEVKDMVLLDVTSLSLGIETAGGIFTKLIDRNTQIPCSKTRVFTTATDGQTVVEVHVLQGERELATHNQSLGRFELRNIPPAPKGVPQIEVTFEVDVNGIVNVSAKDMATGNKQKIMIQSPTTLTPDEVNEMVKEAAIYAEEDARRREEAQVRNKANIELDTAERQIREFKEKMSFSQQSKLRDAIERLRQSLQTYDNDKIKKDTDSLQDAMYAVSTEAYLQTGSQRAAEAAMKAGIHVSKDFFEKEGEGAAEGKSGEEATEKVAEAATEVPSFGDDEPDEDELFGWFDDE